MVELKLPLPSEVYETDTISQTLDEIKTYNKNIGQFLGIGPSSKKISNAKKNQLESQRDTLKKYRDRLENAESAKSLVATTKRGKYGKGVPNAAHEISFYSSVDDLCNKLALLCAAEQAGNNGLNNNINSILDELLRINAIDKNEYNHLYSNIFN